MTSTLVEVFNNQPMTTSLAVAEGIGIQHKNVMAIIKKYITELGALGKSNSCRGVAFETRPFAGEVAFQTRLNQQGSPTEFAWLNEGQAMFLLTLQRNTAKVVQFKLALVQAFLEMRDRLTSQPHRNEPLTLSHRADIMVAADRTFRSVIRASRAAGLKLPAALRRANAITLETTGVDMLTQLQAGELAAEPAPANYMVFLNRWAQGELRYPCIPCRSVDLYSAYREWCAAERQHVEDISLVIHGITDVPALRKRRLRMDGYMCTVVVPFGDWPNVSESVHHFIELLRNA